MPDHYTGQPLTLSLCAGQLTTNNVFISFVSPQPPPRVTALLGCQTSTASPPTLSGCVPSVNTIRIQGHYFCPPISVYVGGKLRPLANEIFRSSPIKIVCYAPLLDSYVPGLFYDLHISATVYAHQPEVDLLVAAISFVPGPILASAMPLTDTLATFSPLYPKCQPGPQLTIVGTGLLPAHPAVCLSIVGIGFSGQCTNLTVLDNEHVVCALPDLGASSRGSMASLTLYTNGNTSSSLALYPYDVLNADRLPACRHGCDQRQQHASGRAAGHPRQQPRAVAHSRIQPVVDVHQSAAARPGQCIRHCVGRSHVLHCARGRQRHQQPVRSSSQRRRTPLTGAAAAV